jgi:hypothetical protein
MHWRETRRGGYNLFYNKVLLQHDCVARYQAPQKHCVGRGIYRHLSSNGRAASQARATASTMPAVRVFGQVA